MNFFLLIMLLTSLLTACGAAAVISVSVSDDKLAEILARGTLIIATDADYAPQSRLIESSAPAVETKCAPTQYTANQFTGFDVSVPLTIVNELGMAHLFSLSKTMA